MDFICSHLWRKKKKRKNSNEKYIYLGVICWQVYKRRSRDMETETDEDLLQFPAGGSLDASSGSLSSVSLSDKSMSTDNVEEYFGDVPFAGKQHRTLGCTAWRFFLPTCTCIIVVLRLCFFLFWPSAWRWSPFRQSSSPGETSEISLTYI